MTMSALNSSKSSRANCIQVVILKKSNSELSYIIVKLFNSFQSSIAGLSLLPNFQKGWGGL